MDTVSTAIITAITTGILNSAGKISQQSIIDSYAGLKSLLKRKFGDQSEVAKSIEGLEAKPDSAARKELLKEEIEAVKAEQDLDICQAAQNLIDKINLHSGENHILQATGNYIAQADRNSTANVNVNQSKE